METDDSQRQVFSRVDFSETGMCPQIDAGSLCHKQPFAFKAVPKTGVPLGAAGKAVPSLYPVVMGADVTRWALL